MTRASGRAGSPDVSRAGSPAGGEQAAAATDRRVALAAERPVDPAPGPQDDPPPRAASRPESRKLAARTVGRQPRWEQDGADWPNRAASRFVTAAGLRWHVQVSGHGPVLLLLHGTGSATHSWAGLLPLLAERFTVIAPDLPGHGFTEALPPARMSLVGMAAAIAGLLHHLHRQPALALGHSAGAAIAARMCLDGLLEPAGIVSLNGALLPFRGLPGLLFGPMARLLALNPLVPHFFSWGARDPTALRRLIASTGSKIDAATAAHYGRLMRDPAHVAAALRMMANWDLASLARDLPRLAPRLLLVASSADRTVAPAEADRVAALVPGARVVRLRGLGHLAHEERPDRIAVLVRQFAVECGVGEAQTAGGRNPLSMAERDRHHPEP